MQPAARRSRRSVRSASSNAHDIFAAPVRAGARSGGVMNAPARQDECDDALAADGVHARADLSRRSAAGDPRARASICAIRASPIIQSGRRLRGESREFLSPWEPVWADDELTKGAFRRRIKRYQKETRLDSAYAFFVFRDERRCPDRRLHAFQCAPRRHPMLRAGLLDRRALRAPGLYVRRRSGADPFHVQHTWGCTASKRPACPTMSRPKPADQGGLPPGRAGAALPPDQRRMAGPCPVRALGR